MANKRILKRKINYVCSNVFAECVAVSLDSKQSDKANIDAIIASLMIIHSDFISRVSHLEPKMKPKVYYNHLIHNFNKQISEIIDQITNIN